MKKRSLTGISTQVLGSLALTLLLTGCIENHFTIQLGTYNSGVIVHELGMTQGYVDLLATFGEGFEDTPDTVYTQAEVAESAAGFGEGVTFLDFAPLNKPGLKGFVARYAFEDITKLSFDPLPITPLEESQSIIPSFSFTPTRVGNSVAIEFIQDAEALASQVILSPTLDPQLEEMTHIFNGLKASFKIEFTGRIDDSQSSATYRDGNTVTIFEIDYDALAVDRDAKLIFLNNRENPLAAWKALSGKPGVKVETQPRISIRPYPN